MVASEPTVAVLAGLAAAALTLLLALVIDVVVTARSRRGDGASEAPETTGDR